MIHTLKQISKYITVGTTAAFIQFALVTLLVDLFHIRPLIANVVGFFSGFVFCYFFHRAWTFSGMSREATTTFIYYGLLALFNFTLNEYGFFLLMHNLHLHYKIALLIDIPAVNTFSFLISKFLVFV